MINPHLDTIDTLYSIIYHSYEYTKDKNEDYNTSYQLPPNEVGGFTLAQINKALQISLLEAAQTYPIYLLTKTYSNNLSNDHINSNVEAYIRTQEDGIKQMIRKCADSGKIGIFHYLNYNHWVNIYLVPDKNNKISVVYQNPSTKEDNLAYVGIEVLPYLKDMIKEMANEGILLGPDANLSLDQQYDECCGLACAKNSADLIKYHEDPKNKTPVYELSEEELRNIFFAPQAQQIEEIIAQKNLKLDNIEEPLNVKNIAKQFEEIDFNINTISSQLKQQHYINLGKDYITMITTPIEDVSINRPFPPSYYASEELSDPNLSEVPINIEAPQSPNTDLNKSNIIDSPSIQSNIEGLDKVLEMFEDSEVHTPLTQNASDEEAVVVEENSDFSPSKAETLNSDKREFKEIQKLINEVIQINLSVAEILNPQSTSKNGKSSVNLNILEDLLYDIEAKLKKFMKDVNKKYKNIDKEEKDILKDAVLNINKNLPDTLKVDFFEGLKQMFKSLKNLFSLFSKNSTPENTNIQSKLSELKKHIENIGNFIISDDTLLLPHQKEELLRENMAVIKNIENRSKGKNSNPWQDRLNTIDSSNSKGASRSQ